MTLAPDQVAWIDRARDADILAVAQRAPVSAKLKKHSREYIGPCPACGGTDRFSVNPNKKGGIFNCRGSGGGNVITMVMHTCGVEFLAACEIINGEPMPAGDRQMSADELKALADQREAERAERDRVREQEADAFREREREKVYETWKRGGDAAGSPVEDYLRHRALQLPPGTRLRFLDAVPYYATGAIDAPVVHRGPVMMAPITDAGGKFRGLHTTWLDLDRPNGKALIRTEAGEELPAKKVRGSMAGNRIVLVACDDPAQIVIGEGIETVLSVWLALKQCGRDLARTAFWSAVSLGNLGGRGNGSVPHPGLKTETGRVRAVSGPIADLESTSIAIPADVTDLVLLGDGDSDRFTTQCTLCRASQRFAHDGRAVRVAWAPDGQDFNDLLREAA